ncbi:MAG: diphthine--ammonia ligase [Oscillospiraceae bacterium]|nr:diphthine--ammonia ligase [Oscillospiraceae bacterium]
MKFVLSYSCGKDSTLALCRLTAQGHEAAGLLVMMNEAAGRSWFHGADAALLARYEDALGLPLLPVPARGADYHLAMEAALRRAKDLGAEAAAFGDIDLAENRRWCEDRCAAAGLPAVFPLWGEDRAALVREALDTGIRCLIKAVDPARLPRSLLGRFLDRDTLREIAAQGADLCGENGEYHTLAVDGPVFRHALPFQTGRTLDLRGCSVVEIL